MDVAVGAVQVGGEAPDARGALRVVEHVDRDAAAADAQRRLQRFDHTIALDAREAHTVLDHFEDDTASCRSPALAPLLACPCVRELAGVEPVFGSLRANTRV